MTSLFSADDLKPCPIFAEFNADDVYYKKEWAEFERQNPNAKIMQTLDFMDTLKERAAKERNFKAMDIYGMPHWFWLANKAECLARQAKINTERGLS